MPELLWFSWETFGTVILWMAMSVLLLPRAGPKMLRVLIVSGLAIGAGNAALWSAVWVVAGTTDLYFPFMIAVSILIVPPTYFMYRIGRLRGSNA